VSSPTKTFTVIVKVATSTRQCSARVVFCAAENLTKKKRDVGVKVVVSVPTTGNCKKKKKRGRIYDTTPRALFRFLGLIYEFTLATYALYLGYN
jgi:hypothetical protein